MARKPAPPRFVADAMLGRLARWLRFLGYDTLYQAGIPDPELVRRAWAEGRVLLTRDRGIPRDWTLARCVLVRSDRPIEQLREVLEALELPPPGGESPRCTICNGRLHAAGRAEVAPLVPPWVAAHHEAFARCSGCGRVYWEGTHATRLRAALARALAGE